MLKNVTHQLFLINVFIDVELDVINRNTIKEGFLMKTWLKPYLWTSKTYCWNFSSSISTFSSFSFLVLDSSCTRVIWALFKVLHIGNKLVLLLLWNEAPSLPWCPISNHYITINLHLLHSSNELVPKAAFKELANSTISSYNFLTLDAKPLEASKPITWDNARILLCILKLRPLSWL